MNKILIIEDDTFLQGLEASKLNKDGYGIATATTGDEAIKKLSEPGITLILLDLGLPNVDGFEVLRKIKENPTTKMLPVIVFSNYSEEKDIKKAKDMGVTDFLVKSNFTLDELAEKIKMVLKP